MRLWELASGGDGSQALPPLEIHYGQPNMSGIVPEGSSSESLSYVMAQLFGIRQKLTGSSFSNIVFGRLKAGTKLASGMTPGNRCPS